MTAILTDVLKKNVLNYLDSDINDSATNYYIAVGRSEDWDSADTAPTPVNSQREIRTLQESLQSAKIVTSNSYVVPRTNWSTGTVYSGYDDAVSGHPDNSYYVLTDANEVYICLQQGRNATGTPVASTIKPNSTSGDSFSTADGYVWRFLYTISALDANNFLAGNFMPVKFIAAVDSDSPFTDTQQKAIQDSAQPGEIANIEVVAGGTSYSTAPTVAITGDGSGAQATATVSGGAVVKVELLDSDGVQHGSGYTYADVSFTGGGGTGASARVTFGPTNGFGADPRDDLRATAFMLNSKLTGEEGGDFIIGNDFRQVALIRNPQKGAIDSDFTEQTGTMLSKLEFASVTQAFTPDNEIEGSTSGAKGIVDTTDSDTVWFHQTEATGRTPFQEGELVTETNGSGSGSLNAAGFDSDTAAEDPGEINPFSGEVLHIDNRAAIVRSAEQTEDIKVIIQL